MRKARTAAAVALGLIQAATAGAAGAQVSAAPGAQVRERPPQAQCAAVRDVDFERLAQEEARLPVAVGRPVVDYLEEVRIPDWAGRRPSPDAPVVVRARVMPNASDGADHSAVVWREADGGWWFWRHSANEGPATSTDAEIAALRARDDARVAGRSREEILWPPTEGRLSAPQAAQMEAAWSDPCRAWDPYWWPRDIPLNRTVDGSNRGACPPNPAVIFADMVEAGGPRRRVGGACINDTPTYRMIQITAYAAADAPS